MNAVASYIDARYEQLGLGRFGITRRPPCLFLTPRFSRSRHVIVLVLGDGRGEPRLVAKLPRLPDDVAPLAREADNLRALGDSGIAPELVAFDTGPGHPLLLETALTGRPLSPAALRRDRRGTAERVARWLGRLAADTAMRPGEQGWYERLVAAPLGTLIERGEQRALAARTLSLAACLREAGLPLVFEHGDLCHPNLLLASDGRLGVLDWERAEPAGLPAHDLFFFLGYAAGPGVGDAFRGRRPWAWRLAERYAAQLGIDTELLAPLLAVSCARSVAAGGREPRHRELWRLAVEELTP